MSFQVGSDSLGGTMFFQAGLCTPLRTMHLVHETLKSAVSFMNLADFLHADYDVIIFG